MKRLLTLLPLAVALFAQPAAEIRGYAWSAEGKPIAGAKIVVRGAGAAKDATTAADGSFTLKDLKPGKYEITAESAKESLATESSTAVDVKEGEMAHADITLGVSTIHHGYWSRLVRRLDGLH